MPPSRALACLRVSASLLVILADLWAIAALAIDIPIPWLRLPSAIVLAGTVGWIFWRFGRRWLAPGLATGCFLAVLGWWLSLTPSDDRAWQADVAVMPSAEIVDQRITVHGIRACEYRSEFDYDVRHHDGEFALADLRTADLFLVYWGSPAIAHTMISFGFADGRFLCFSIEARKEVGESYSAALGFFRRFESIIVVADERDLVGLRTTHRQGEDVYLYRLRMAPDAIRSLLLDYMAEIDRLHRTPAWYNALTANCTTAIPLPRAAGEGLPWDWRILLNGHLDELLYERRLIATSMPLAELRQRSLINPRTRNIPPDADFSQWIRREIPAEGP